MEGEGEKLPREEGGKKSMTKIIAAIIVIILVVAAIGAAVVLMGGKETEHAAPTASFSVSVEVVNTTTPVTFDATGSTASDATIVNYTWQFGDGAEQVSTSAQITHTYAYPGKYVAILTVTDSKDATKTTWSLPARVEVLNPAPSVAVNKTTANTTLPFALVGASADVVQNGTILSFNANSSGAYSLIQNATGKWVIVDFGIKQVKNVEWHFGDGSPVVSGNTKVAGAENHTYEGDGTVYASYAIITGNHTETQRYYNTVVVLPVGQTTGGGAKNPDTFTTAEFGEPQSLDPAWDYESSGGEIIQNVYETLVWYNGSSSSVLMPMLATEVPSVANGGISPDFMNYTYHIRAGVKFHTGETMTGADVVYSLKRVLIMNDARGPAWMLSQFMIKGLKSGKALNSSQMSDMNASIELTDPMTVTLHLLMPMPAFNYIMAYTVGSVVSEAFVEAHGGVKAPPNQENSFMDRNMDGTGPFKLLRWAPNQDIVMVRNDNYWRAEPTLKYVIIKKVQDVGTRLLYIKSGQVDSVMYPVQQRSDVANNLDITLYERLPTLSVTFIVMTMNITAGKLPIGDIPLKFFSDLNVRKAFCTAFDYQKFIDKVTLGTGLRANGPIIQGLLGYDPNIPMYNYNLTQAVNYLKAAKDTRTADPSDTYADNGFHMTLYYNAGNVGRQTACLMMKDSFTLISNNATLGTTGVNFVIDVLPLDWPTYLDARENNELPAFYIGWLADYPDPDDFANPLLATGGAFPYYSGLDNHTLTVMIANAALETNNTIRIQAYHNISMSCYDNAYYVFTAQPTAFYVFRTWVNGFIYNMMYSLFYYYPMSKG